MTFQAYMGFSLMIAAGIAGAIIYGATGSLPTFGRPDYDPNEIAKDGPFRAPRKWLHVQKILIGCTVYAVALSIFRALELADAGKIAATCSAFLPIIFSGIREAIAPTDPDRHTLGEHLCDTFTDGALSCVPIVLEVYAEGRWIAAASTFVVLAIVYRVCRNGARP